VFWASDISRLPCSYSTLVRFFATELPFLDDKERELVLGRGLCEWLDWHPESAETKGE
jgi:hypothetical protein